MLENTQTVGSDPYDQILMILQEIGNKENLEIKQDSLTIILGEMEWNGTAKAD